MIEVELKIERTLAYPGSACICGNPATKTVMVGEIQNSYGTDYDLCPREECLERAMDSEIEEIEYVRNHRRELTTMEHCSMREGK